jgi:hypothetical protein
VALTLDRLRMIGHFIERQNSLPKVNVTLALKHNLIHLRSELTGLMNLKQKITPLFPCQNKMTSRGVKKIERFFHPMKIEQSCNSIFKDKSVNSAFRFFLSPLPLYFTQTLFTTT